MKVCIVGQGPSAKGRGREIDACEFVVRLKEFWLHGAEDAGERIDAWATRGNLDPGAPPKGRIEYWYVLSCGHFAGKPPDEFKQEMFAMNNRARGAGIRWTTIADYKKLSEYLHHSPSTFMVVVVMALQAFPSCNLVVYGFDSTTPDQPRYDDARPPSAIVPNTLHDFVAEKRAIAEIAKGTWLGKPTAATLTWPDMPECIK